MKKIFSCILAIIILGAMLSGCSNNDSKVQFTRDYTE